MNEPAVAPDRQAVRREPVDADVSRWRCRRRAGSGRNPRRPGVFGVIEVGDGGVRRLRLERAGEEQELLDLVRADVAEDAASPLTADRTSRGAGSCRPGAARGRSVWSTTTDGALPDQLAGLRSLRVCGSARNRGSRGCGRSRLRAPQLAQAVRASSRPACRSSRPCRARMARTAIWHDRRGCRRRGRA